jgi:hypothetical protein
VGPALRHPSSACRPSSLLLLSAQAFYCAGLLIRDGGHPGAWLRRDHALTSAGETLVDALGIDLDAMRASRRVFARSCLGWTQRRPHLAGVLPAALTQRFLADGWLIRGTSRAVHTAPDYDHRLETWLTRPG